MKTKLSLTVSLPTFLFNLISLKPWFFTLDTQPCFALSIQGGINFSRSAFLVQLKEMKSFSAALPFSYLSFCGVFFINFSI
ncbi:hypothetical protein [Holdemania massiliensis]|uniref:hypothetical protein n=1 Tax=Holdemania massiliensis TaxID=1468449 RepID=UPI001C9C248F|nr:hypothetical protein [Holdemania massiliensis]